MNYVPREAVYDIVDDSAYEIQDGVVLFKKKGTEHFVDLGDCDSARANITVNKISRKSKNRKVRAVAVERIVDVEADLVITAFQFIDEVRALALMGDPVPHVQDSEDWEFVIHDAQPGGFYLTGALDIYDFVGAQAVVDQQTGEVTAGVALAAGTVTSPDTPLGIIKLAMTGFAKGDTIHVSGKKAAITAAMNRTRIEFLSRNDIEGEIIIRGVGANGAKASMHFYSWLTSSSGVDFIGGDDFSSQELSGKIQLTDRGIGTWQKLSA